MRSKPVIGINTDYVSGPRPRLSYCALWAGYFDCVHQAGAVPIIFPPIPDLAAIHQMLDRVDGVVLIGGGDLDPLRDGCHRHHRLKLLDPRREDFDRMLARALAQRHIPVFGIGAGMQLLNVSQGGKLMLHIPDDKDDALPHWDSSDPNHRHGLRVLPDSLLGRVYGESEIRVNSMHHMAVDEVAPGFRATAFAPDGLIEAIESTSPDWFAIGTQFHPEADSASALDFRIFEEFVDAVKRRSVSVRLAA
ncbi:MAG: gamma-glutamyl-gamma-aminobutyrate hydrolase family protein [Thermoguttaceae bacterium]|nr:gamma-glutamyl-gamma-aminobutyrate hydrolase family protein [Thermoguttaceae bacterium]MDW8078452.1 gamma-glutamyl-gamma-aminobutyrate hydrolase family protein [Thermoguttaceae bacterium]